MYTNLQKYVETNNNNTIGYEGTYKTKLRTITRYEATYKKLMAYNQSKKTLKARPHLEQG